MKLNTIMGLPNCWKYWAGRNVHNTDTIARIKSNNQTSRPITITNGVRQGDSLSPMLFNLIIDKIIANLPRELGYKMGNNPI